MNFKNVASESIRFTSCNSRMQQRQQHITNKMLRECLLLETVHEVARHRQLAWLGLI